MLLMGLRLTEGIDLETMARRFGFAPASSEVADLESMGLIEILEAADDDADIIRACIGPGIAPAAVMAVYPPPPHHPRRRHTAVLSSMNSSAGSRSKPKLCPPPFSKLQHFARRQAGQPPLMTPP